MKTLNPDLTGRRTTYRVLILRMWLQNSVTEKGESFCWNFSLEPMGWAAQPLPQRRCFASLEALNEYLAQLTQMSVETLPPVEDDETEDETEKGRTRESEGVEEWHPDDSMPVAQRASL